MYIKQVREGIAEWKNHWCQRDKLASPYICDSGEAIYHNS